MRRADLNKLLWLPRKEQSLPILPVVPILLQCIMDFWVFVIVVFVCCCCFYDVYSSFIIRFPFLDFLFALLFRDIGSFSCLVLISYLPVCVSEKELFLSCLSHVVTFKQKLGIWPLGESVPRLSCHFSQCNTANSRQSDPVDFSFFFFCLTSFPEMLRFPLVPLGNRLICLFFLNLRINCCTLLFCSHIQDLLQILWTKTKTFQFLLVKNITEPTGSSCRLSQKS